MLGLSRFLTIVAVQAVIRRRRVLLTVLYSYFRCLAIMTLRIFTFKLRVSGSVFVAVAVAGTTCEHASIVG